MLRRAGFWGGAVLLGALIGALVTMWSLPALASLGQVQIGAWRHNPAAGAAAADPYTRALVARSGLLALNSHETIYFSIAEDDRGEPLEEACVYELTGGDLPARWWSVTIYAPDDYLPRNDDHAFSMDATRISAAAGAAWTTRISQVKGDAVNWISSHGARNGYILTLRLYQPQQEAREHPASIALPHLARISCPGDPT